MGSGQVGSCPERANREQPWVKPTGRNENTSPALKGPDNRSTPLGLVQFYWAI